jgi:hypothetical protein
VEEDVCLQSVRMMWLGVTSPSAPPVAVDSRNEVRAQLAAFDEQYSIPKKSALRTSVGVGAALLTFAFVAYAGFRLAYGPSAAKQAPAPELEPPKPTAAAPLDVPSPPPLEPAAPPETAEPPAAAPPPPTDEVPKPAAEPPTRERHSSRALRPRKHAEKQPETKAPANLFPTEPDPFEATPLPDVKPPPEFDKKPDTKPSDNPYKDDDAPSTNAPSDNPY